MFFDHIGQLVVRLQPLPFETVFPALEENPRVALSVLVPEPTKGFFEQVGGIEPRRHAFDVTLTNP